MRIQPINDVKEIEGELQKLLEGKILIKRSKLARMLDMSPNFLNEALDEANVPYYTQGRDPRLRVSDVSKWLASIKTFSR